MNLMAKLSCFVDTPEKMEPQLMDGLYHIPVGKSVVYVLDCKMMVEDLGNCGQCQPETGFLGCIRKEIEQGS